MFHGQCSGWRSVRFTLSFGRFSAGGRDDCVQRVSAGRRSCHGDSTCADLCVPRRRRGWRTGTLSSSLSLSSSSSLFTFPHVFIVGENRRVFTSRHVLCVRCEPVRYRCDCIGARQCVASGRHDTSVLAACGDVRRVSTSAFVVVVFSYC